MRIKGTSCDKLEVIESDRQKGEYVLIIEDKGQKEGLHILKNRYFKSHDMEVLRAPLPLSLIHI